MNFMVIIKRSGEEVLFDRRKIENAIAKANTSVEEWERASAKDRELVARRVEEIAETAGHPMGVEEIQDAVEEELMKLQLFKLARNYTVYRYKREIARKSRTVEHPETFSSEQEAWNRVKSLALADQDDKEVAEVRYNKDACEAMVICSDKTFCKFFAEKRIPRKLCLWTEIPGKSRKRLPLNSGKHIDLPVITGQPVS